MSASRPIDEDGEANQFAMELLMPEQWVRDEVAKIKDFDLLSDKHIAALAKKFEVSPQVMAFRIGQILTMS